MNQDDVRRAYRHRRRVRNTGIAYASLVLMIALVVTGVVFGVGYLRKLHLGGDEAAQASAAAEAQRLLEQQAAMEEEQAEAAPVENTEEPSDEAAFDMQVESMVMSMTLEEKAAGIFLITPEALTGVSTVIRAGDATKEAIAQYPIGGLIYSSKNIQSEEQLSEMLSKVKEFSKYPLFLGISEEGGEFLSLANNENMSNVAKVEGAAEIGAGNDPQKARDAGTTIGGYLSHYGFNMDLAPVADVLSDPENEALKSRSYGSDPALVSQMAAAMADGLQSSGVSAAMMHFPGLGGGEKDPRDGKSVIEKSLEELQAQELLPFQAGIEAGVDFIVVSNACYTALSDGETPASLSDKVIQGLLREQLGYQGIVVTDALNMSSVSDEFSSAEAVVAAINAGADMVMMPEDFKEAYEGLLDALAGGAVTEERLNESLMRIFRVKYRDGTN